MKFKNEEREKGGFSIDKDSELTPERAMASNSITILNAANTILFYERDLNCSEIPYAILSD